MFPPVLDPRRNCDDAIVSRPPLGSSTTGVTIRQRLVIVGNGMAGFKLCESLSRNGASRRYDIVVFGEEPRPAYDRVHLTDFLGGRAAEDLGLAPREWYAANRILLRTGLRVVAIDRDRRRVQTNDGESTPYDKLVLATGSGPFRPPIAGLDLPGVFVYRTVEDLHAIRDRARNSSSAAVIGGGLLGLEAARALHVLGVQCHVLEHAPHVLVAQLDEAAGRIAQTGIEGMGIRVRTDARVRSVEADGGKLVVRIGEDCLSVNMVVVAAGVRPRIELGKAADLDTAEVGGIIVNDRLETSDPDIYAVGECVSHRGVTYGLVAPCYRMAEVLAANLMGQASTFEGADVSTRLKVLGLDVAVIGDYKQPGRVVTWSANGHYRRLVLDRDRLMGASALGGWPEAGRIQDAVARRRRIWPWQLARFRHEGFVWKAAPTSVQSWSDARTVCNCMKVSCGTLRRAVAAGSDTVENLARTTGASTLCGSCRPLLQELTGAPATVTWGAVRGLAGASAGALLLIAAAFVAGPVSYPDTVRVPIPFDTLWRDPLWKQASGFGLLGLGVAGLAMSVRKRWARFRWGGYPSWQTVHAIAGVVGLLVLAAHTGFRFGSNLNFVLMTSFVGANLAGALTGALRGSAIGVSRLGHALTWAHILFVWPLPVLVGFHVIAAYFF